MRPPTPDPVTFPATYTVYSPTPSYQGRCENGAMADHATTSPSMMPHHTGARSGRAASHSRRSRASCGPVAKVAMPPAIPSS